MMSGMRSAVFASVVVAGSIAWSAGPAAANILTFDNNVCPADSPCINYSFIAANYGSDANVAVSYNYNVNDPMAGNQLQWWDQYSSTPPLLGVAWGASGGTPEIFLNPLLGQSVTLTGLDFGSYQDANRTSQLTILDGAGNVLLASTPFSVAATPVHYALNLTSANGIRIQWGPDGFDVGIDNVNFSIGPTSAVPFPLAGAGLPGLIAAFCGLVALARRRRVATAA